MKILVSGYKGKIGQRLVALGALPMNCDVANKSQVVSAFNIHKPDLVIHAAAKSSVDFCQENYNKAFDVNVLGTSLICQEANKRSAKVLFLSSEQVFDGRWGKYKEANKPKKQKNTYGQTKYIAEALAELWSTDSVPLFGTKIETPRNIKILRLSRGVSRSDTDIDGAFACMESPQFTAPSFFYRNYQHVDFLAEQIWWCANHFYEVPKILHLGGSEYLSWYDFVKRLANANGYKGKVIKRRQDKKFFVPRPHRCGFNVSLAKKIGVPMHSVDETIERLLNE